MFSKRTWLNRVGTTPFPESEEIAAIENASPVYGFRNFLRIPPEALD
jgi:hypothetical protein